MDADPCEPSNDATLSGVAQYGFRVSPHAPASVVYAEFQRNPMLPGAIVAAGDSVVGLVSRQRFFQLLSHRFGASLFLDAPVQKIIASGPPEFLALDATMSIHDAARRCLARPREEAFEPVLVVRAGGTPRLLGMHELLLAQSHQLTLAHNMIQRQIETVEAAAQAKGNFLANMSHEIRTPLNAIVGMTELLLDSSLSPRQREYADTVIDSCENLLAIINDILDFSKIESGRLELERVGFDLREHLGDTLKGMAVKACRRGLELAFRCAADVPRQVVGDPVRLRQVVLNLVGNAIKFTHEGEVVVEVELEERCDNDAVLHFYVRDTGIGIPRDKLGLIFDAFEQADTSTTREYGGTGLGLAISQRLVDLMQGVIWVESEVGAGSQFHFTARMGAPAAKFPTDESHRAEGTRVLVVEGNCTSRDILLELLATWKFEADAVVTAADAQAALAAAAQSRRPFGLAIISSELPDGCGFDFVDLLAGRELPDKLPVLILIPAERSAAARADRATAARCLMRPVKQSEFFDAILEALGERPSEEKAARRHDGDEPTLPPLKILVGEDSAVNQKLIYEMLTRRGHLAIVAANGEELLAHLAGGTFDLVLMDVQMPRMDGFEATRRIRSNENSLGRRIPIVAMTAHALPEDRERCLAAGMDEYVAKPIRSRALMSAIAAALRQERLASPVNGSEAAPGASSTARAIDWRQALQEFDGNAQILQVVVEAALEETPRMAAAIRAAVEARDATRLRLAAHTLKGSLRYFGDTPAYDLAVQLEHMGCGAELVNADAVCMQFDAALSAALDDMSGFLRNGADAAEIVVGPNCVAIAGLP